MLIGLFDDPGLPRYNRRREVAYCSGACLMVETSVFNSLGGFDDAFAPAYSEDVDLCFRLRETGLRVIYAPQSIAVHHLSVSISQVSSEYKTNLSVRNQQRLCERWQKQIDALNEVRLIAFYLPQFYPIRENDLNWGKGFTEWRNVARATPNFVGHCQSRLPADLGFYDLRVIDVMKEQARLAKRYGIHGFCFYYYWFNGHRVLEMPLDRLLQTGEPNIPFCIAWANENWTRKWDGSDHDIILAQRHSEMDDVAVIKDVSRYLSHPNYIRIDGRPILIVYRPALFPNIKRTTETWRNWCRAESSGEIFLVMVASMEHALSDANPANLGFDAVIEFPPHGMGAPIGVPGQVVNPRFRGTVHNYVDTALKYAAKQLPGHLLFRGVMTGWDNTPRSQDKPDIFHNATPGSYQAWLESVMQDSRETTFGDERCVFVNAWNEWAEGAFLEPDLQFGCQYLEATRNAHYGWVMQDIRSEE
jgi:lipopolysaccharide biosynthesis protein